MTDGVAIPTAVKAIVAKIKESLASKKAIVSFDFSDNPSGVASRVIQKVLIEKGYMVYIVFGQKDDRMTERMYIDLTRRCMLFPEVAK